MQRASLWKRWSSINTETQTVNNQKVYPKTNQGSP